MTGFNSKREAAADKLQEPWNEDEWRRNNWRCGHGWLRGEQCEICNAPQPAQEPVREALKLALITLEGWDNHDKWVWPETALEQVKRNTKEAITAIQEALAQPAQEPVNLLEARKIAAEYGTPDSQMDDGNLYFALSKCLEHIDAQPAQEPVAHVYLFDHEGRPRIAWDKTKGIKIGDKLYTAPPQREWVGLTGDELADLWYKESLDWMEFAQAHEAKLKERNHGT